MHYKSLPIFHFCSFFYIYYLVKDYNYLDLNKWEMDNRKGRANWEKIISLVWALLT